MTQEKARALFELAGLPASRLWKLENRYWPEYPEYHQIRFDNPWWLAKTEFGLIEIGWRKRVIQINWSDTNFKTVVTEDPVTQDDYIVHAWSYEDAVKYLTELGKQMRAKIILIH